MTENEFWRAVEKTLATELKKSDDYKEKMLRRLVKLLTDNSDDLRDAEAREREKLLKKLFVQAGYNRYWNIVQESFDRIHRYQNELWKRETTAETPLPRSHTRLIALEKVQFERFGDLGRDSVRELSREYKEAALKGRSKAELIERIKPIGGKVATYAGAIADSGLRGWDRTITATKAEIAGVDRALYDGPALRPNSHDFCIRHYQQEYSREEIENMSNGQLDPVITYAGGYNCVHRWRWRIAKVLK